MAIVLKYGAPGQILQSGFAAGVGSRKNKQQEQLLDIWQQQTQQAFAGQQALLDRQQRANLQQQGFQFQADMELFNQAGQDFRAAEQRKFGAEQNRLDRNAQDVQATAARFARAGEAELDRDQQLLIQKNQQEYFRARDTEEGLRKGEMELPPPVQQKLDQLEGGLVDAMKLDPAQQQEFRQKYEQEKRELLGLAKPKPQMSRDDTLRKTFGDSYEKEKGKPYYIDSQGEPKLPAGYKDPAENQLKQQQEAQKKVQDRQQAVTSKAEKLFAEKDELTGKPKYASFGEALREADNMQREADSFFSGTPQPQPESGSSVNPDGSIHEWARRAEPSQAPAQETQIQHPGGAPAGIPAPDGSGRILSGPGIPGTPPVDEQLLKTMTDNGAKDPARAAAVYQSIKSGQAFGGSTAGGAGTYGQPVPSQYTPEMRKSILDGSQLPRPQSAEEASALGKGASWVAPDGTIRRNP
jgi:hypothetical protein